MSLTCWHWNRAKQRTSLDCQNYNHNLLCKFCTVVSTGLHARQLVLFRGLIHRSNIHNKTTKYIFHVMLLRCVLKKCQYCNLIVCESRSLVDLAGFQNDVSLIRKKTPEDCSLLGLAILNCATATLIFNMNLIVRSLYDTA